MVKQSFKYIGIVLLASMLLVLLAVKPVYAQELGSDNTSTTDGSQQQSSSPSSNNALSNYMRNYNPITNDNMQKASSYASPIVNALGTLTGFILIVVIAAIAVVTALDLCYIMIPITRSFLGGTPDTPQGGGMMGGGYGMGMHTGNGAMHGHKWVSDEAVQAVQASGAGAGTPQGNMGMGMMGGLGMGGMQGMQAQASSPKTVLGTYFKKRLFVLIIFAIACTVLTSSALTNCGINIGMLIIKVINKLSGAVTTVNV